MLSDAPPFSVLSMKMNWKIIHAAIVLLFACQMAAAQTRRHSWPCDLSLGLCIGKVTYSAEKTFWKKTAGKYEWRFFTNGDSLAINRTREPNTKMLALRDGSTFLHGISLTEKIDEDTVPDDTRTLFNSILLILKGYPDGISSMQSAWQSRDIAHEGKTFHLAVQKLSSTSFDFRYSDDRDWDVSGTWSIEKHPLLKTAFLFKDGKTKGHIERSVTRERQSKAPGPGDCRDYGNWSLAAPRRWPGLTFSRASSVAHWSAAG